jgi:two-component sensor histidine kinase
MYKVIVGSLLLISIQSVAQIVEPPLGNKTRAEYLNMLADSLSISKANRDTANIIRFAAVLTTWTQGTSNEKAAQYLEIALRYSKGINDPKWYADVCNRVGMLMLNYARDLTLLRNLNITSNQVLDSSMYWHRQAVKRGLAINREVTAGWGYRGLMATANAHYNKAVRDSIPIFYKKAIRIANRANDQELVSYCNVVYSDYWKEKGDTAQAHAALKKVSTRYFPDGRAAFRDNLRIANLIDSLTKAETSKDTAHIIEHSFNLSLLFRGALMYEQSATYIEVALRYAKQYSDSFLLAYAYLHKGELMADLNKSDSAIYYYNSTIETDSLSSAAGWAHYQLLEIAIDNDISGDSIKSLYDRALRIGGKGDHLLVISSQLSNYKYLMRTGQLQKAEEVLKKLYLKLPVMDIWRKEIFYSCVHDYLAQVNDLDTLVRVKDLIIEQRNFVTAATHQEQLYVKDQQYEVSKTKNVLTATTNKLALTNKVLIILIIASLLFLVLVIYLFFLFRKNKRLSKRNELLLREQNHRVKNNLQMISSLLSLQSQKLQSSDAKAVLEDSQGRISSVALLHRMLYEGEQVGQIEVVSYLKSLTEELKYGANRDVEVELNLPQRLELKIEKVTSIGLIVNELFTNSLKHVRTSIPLMVHLKISVVDGKLSLIYKDNGHGVSPMIWKSSVSFGNQLVQLQSKQLKGEYEIRVENGFRYELKITA